MNSSFVEDKTHRLAVAKNSKKRHKKISKKVFPKGSFFGLAVLFWLFHVFSVVDF